LIQLIERRGNEYSTNHILIRMGSSELDMKEAQEYLDSLRTEILDNKITFEKAAKEYSDDKYTAASGGFILDETGASRISVEDIDPVLFFTLDSMKLGTITKPMVFRKDDGSEAVRILFYKERLKPHQANLNDDYQKIQAAALSEKRNRILAKWFDEAKNSVYIDIDPEYDRCNILQ
jgi:peptidyl-prolyl cis-trans isomerase SurA